MNGRLCACTDGAAGGRNAWVPGEPARGHTLRRRRFCGTQTVSRLYAGGWRLPGSKLLFIERLLYSQSYVECFHYIMSLKSLNWGYREPHLGLGHSGKGLPSIPEALGSIPALCKLGVVAPASHPSPRPLAT